MGLYSAAGIVCQPLVGAWVDAFGRRPFMRFGTAAVVVTELVALVSDSVGVFGVLRLLQGVGYSAFFVSNYTMAIDLVPVERRGWALGIYGVAGLTSLARALRRHRPLDAHPGARDRNPGGAGPPARSRPPAPRPPVPVPRRLPRGRRARFPLPGAGRAGDRRDHRRAPGRRGRAVQRRRAER